MTNFILLPILWKDGDAAILEELGIDTPYEEAEVKEVWIKKDEIKWFFADKNPRYTCITLSDTEMVVNLPIELFMQRLILT